MGKADTHHLLRLWGGALKELLEQVYRWPGGNTDKSLLLHQNPGSTSNTHKLSTTHIYYVSTRAPWVIPFRSVPVSGSSHKSCTPAQTTARHFAWTMALNLSKQIVLHALIIYVCIICKYERYIAVAKHALLTYYIILYCYAILY